MITKTKAYTSGDGKVHATIEAAQKSELEALFNEISQDVTVNPVGHEYDIAGLCDAIIKRRDRFKDILATTENSRPRARKINKLKPKSKAAEILDNAAAMATLKRVAKMPIVDLDNLRPDPQAASLYPA